MGKAMLSFSFVALAGGKRGTEGYGRLFLNPADLGLCGALTVITPFE